MLFSATKDFDPPAQQVSFGTLGNPATAALAIQRTTQIGSVVEEPPLPAGGSFLTTANTQMVRVDETSGFTAIVPLWDQALGNQYDYNVTLKGLKGFLLPFSMGLQLNASPVGTGSVFQVRLEIFPLEVSEEEALLGNSLFSSRAPVVSFSRAFQRRRIFWKRTYYVPANNTQGFSYFLQNAEPTTGLEPKLAGIEGGPTVRLKNMMRITRQRWPVLGVSVAGFWPTGVTQNLAGGGATEMMGFANGVLCNIALCGELRAYLLRG